MALGYDHESFWDQTPKTLSLTFDAARIKSAVEHNERAWLAYHVGVLHRTKKLPPLRKLQVRIPDQHRQSPEEMQAILKQWTLSSGGKIVKPN